MTVEPPILGRDTDLLTNEDGWIIEILDHSFSVLQTFRPEALHFIQRIRAIEDLDFEVSNYARNFAGNLVVDRDIPTNEDSIKAWKHMFHLKRIESNVEIKIMGGPITATNMAKGRDFVKISGKDWMHYLERRQVPFNPFRPMDYRFGPTVTSTIPPVNMSYQVPNRDVARIIDDVLTVIFDRPHSLPITWTLSNISIAINFALTQGDTSTALSIIDGVSEYWPGFDYRVSYDREFVMWSPYRFGDPDTTADDGPSGGNIAYAFGDYYGHPVVDVDYTNTGPQSTHLFGTGAGTGASQLGSSLGASDIQTGYWRLDGAVSFGDQAKTQAIVDKRTRKEFIFGAQEVHEINLTVDPQSVPDFWNTIRPGFAIWLREDLQMHEINSAQRIVSMERTVDNEYNEQVVLGLNQIYNTSTHYGLPEG